MSKPPRGAVTPDTWIGLCRLTAARIALGRAGMSLPTARHLEFQLAHARARDAVHAGLDAEDFSARLRSAGHDVLVVASAAPDRITYLQRPDLGRALSPDSRELLDRRGKPGRAREKPAGAAKPRYDALFVIADGLSALAVERNAAPLLAAILPRLAPVVVVTQGRVAIGDEIGAQVGAGLVAVLIGERPGLSAPDSLGIYLTHAPKVGRVDAERNCISNVRDGGLGSEAAAATLFYLMTEARRRRVTGVELKDETAALLPAPGGARNFLIEDGRKR